MVEENIKILKEKLDQLVANNAPYDELYKVSQQLDEYIAQYYREKEYKNE